MPMTTTPADLDRKVRLEIFRQLVEGGAVPTVDSVAKRLGLAQQATGGSFERLAVGRAIVLRPGTRDIWMAPPFSCVPTGFEVESGGIHWYGNCIWDSFGVLALLDGEGVIRSACPDCGKSQEVLVAKGSLAGDAGVVHFTVPASQWWDDIGYT